MGEFIPKNRNYSSWEIIDTSNNPVVFDKNFDPVANKVLKGDVISSEFINRCSKYRNAILPGILKLNNKTYGRSKDGNFFFKIIPNDKVLPVFLVSYKEKNNFSKLKNDKYVLFTFKCWNIKHPECILSNVLGNIEDDKAYYDYLLYSKNLFRNNYKNLNSLKKTIENYKLPNIEDRSDSIIITIDPTDCTDFDDAIGLIEQCDGNKILSIYITDTVHIINHCNLWNRLYDNVSTIYLPFKKQSLLPKLLCDNICSLRENFQRQVMSLDLYLDCDNNIIKKEFKTAIIKVTKNFVYEEKDLIESELYKNIFQICNSLFENITDSHDVISNLMILINHYAAQLLFKNKCGIFRISENTNNNMSLELSKHIQDWTPYTGSYCLHEDNIGHKSLCLNEYCQISSPIRRIVDIINMLYLNNIIDNYLFNKNINDFLDYWNNNLEYLNKLDKSIKKIQNTAYIYNISKTIDFSDGYVIDCFLETKKSKIKLYVSSIYLINIKSIFNIQLDYPLTIYNKYSFKIYCFEDEINLRKKIKLQLIS